MSGLLRKLLLSTLIAAAPVTAPWRHWTETDSETLWTVRYINCDYGFYVLLAQGIVAHSTHAPSPNHGFLISLSDLGKTAPSSHQTEKRYIWVDASYDSSDDQSREAASSETMTELKLSNPSRVRRTSARLAGLRAIEATADDSDVDGGALEETVVAIRSGIVYTVGLRTTKADRAADEKQFNRIVSGLKLLRLPSGECSNG